MPTDRSSPVAARVRELMEQQKLTQEKVADALGISQESVSRRVRGVFEWRTSELVVVAELLGTTPAALFAEPAEQTL